MGQKQERNNHRIKYFTMIKHIVFWTLKENAESNDKATNASIIKTMLEELNDKISCIVKLEVGIDFSKTAHSAEVALYSEFNTKEDLEAYQSHPDHKRVAQFVAKCVESRVMVDYEI
jgi:hypothetical protein